MIGSNSHEVAFLFDVDGVLVHSMPLHMQAWEEYLASLGIEVEDLERRMHGKRNAELVTDLISKDLTEAEAFAHGARKEELWREMLLRDGVERYQVAGLRQFLEKHRTVPKAVASNAEPKNIDFVLDQYGLRRYFEAAVSGMEVARPKPFPDIYLEAARRLGAKPEACIVFEDSPTGLEAAIGAGMRVIGIETTPADLTGSEIKVPNFSDPRLEEWLAREVLSR